MSWSWERIVELDPPVSFFLVCCVRPDTDSVCRLIPQIQGESVFCTRWIFGIDRRRGASGILSFLTLCTCMCVCELTNDQTLQLELILPVKNKCVYAFMLIWQYL